MSDTLVNVLVVLAFTLIGGMFAAAEIALVSLREGQVKALAERGRRGQRVAKLVSDPNRFLAAVQVGVTLAGFLSAAFGASRLSEPLGARFAEWGLPRGVADGLAFVLVVVLITYASLVLGELAPKRVGLQRAEGVAMGLGPIVDRVAWLFRPVIWLLSKSTDLVVRLIGVDPQAQGESITQQELRDLVSGHEALSLDERKLIDEVFAAGERQLREVMIPRTEVAFLEAQMPLARAARLTAEQPHSRYPVSRDSQDDVLGFVHVRDLMMPQGRSRNATVADVTRDVKLMPGSKRVLPAMSEMRREGHHLAIVVDEYGGTAGIVTLEDLIEEVVGDIRDEYDREEDELRFRGGEIEADGLLNLDEVHEQTGVRLPDGPYETLAGYVTATLGHLPSVGEAVEVEDHRLQVCELDGRRVSRVRVTPLPPADGGATEPDDAVVPEHEESRT